MHRHALADEQWARVGSELPQESARIRMLRAEKGDQAKRYWTFLLGCFNKAPRHWGDAGVSAAHHDLWAPTQFS